VYVDIIVTWDDVYEIAALKHKLKAEFVGMEVARSKEGLIVSQRKYTLNLLKDTEIITYKPRYIPLERNLKYVKRDNDS